MGGYGSGQRWSKKRAVEQCNSIDTAELKQWNLLAPGVTDHAGSFEWRRRGEEKPSSSVSYSLTVEQNTGTLRIMYSIKSMNAELDYPIQLETTSCHLGGVRWWFICPLSRSGIVCERRVRKLYLSGKYFGCRHCHGLTYTSTQESDSRVYALLRGGLEAIGDPRRMSVSQLGLSLKALTLQQRRLERFGLQLQ